jgi:hypothetical protein
MRLAELHAINTTLAAFNAGIAQHFNAHAPATRHMPQVTTTHKFEWPVKGIQMDIEFQTRWDTLEAEDRLVYGSIKVLHDGDDISDLMADSVFNTVVRECERRLTDPQGEWS